MAMPLRLVGAWQAGRVCAALSCWAVSSDLSMQELAPGEPEGPEN